MIGEEEFHRFVDMRRSDDSLARSFREIVAFDGFGVDSFFGDELYRRAEEVVEEPPFFGVEVIEQGGTTLGLSKRS